MELIDRISGLEGEMNTVKGEIKKVLIDLREAMSATENPFTHIEQLQHVGGTSSIEEERIKSLEDAIGELRTLHNDNSIEEERIRSLEDAIEGMKALHGDTTVDDDRIKNLEDAMEELKVMGVGNRMDDEMLKRLSESMQELNEQGNLGTERLKNLEAAIGMLDGTMAQSPSEKQPFRNLAASEPDLNKLGIRFGTEVERGTGGNAMVDTLTLAQLIHWADNALNLIGLEKLNQVIDLYELTGRLSKGMKDTIAKITELPAAYLDPGKEHVETKYCILALFELDRILTGENQELFTLLRELC